MCISLAIKNNSPKMIENWPFYILQKVEPRDYDDSVKNDKDFDVSPKLNVTSRLYLFSNTLRRLYVFPHFTRVSCLLARVLSCLTLWLRGKKDESRNERESTASHLFARTRCLTTPRFSACYYLLSLAWFPRFPSARVTCYLYLHVFPRIFLLRVLIGSLDFCRRKVKLIPCPVPAKR